jgi:hypothetical protein
MMISVGNDMCGLDTASQAQIVRDTVGLWRNVGRSSGLPAPVNAVRKSCIIDIAVFGVVATRVFDIELVRMGRHGILEEQDAPRLGFPFVIDATDWQGRFKISPNYAVTHKTIGNRSADSIPYTITNRSTNRSTRPALSDLDTVKTILFDCDFVFWIGGFSIL